MYIKCYYLYTVTILYIYIYEALLLIYNNYIAYLLCSLRQFLFTECGLGKLKCWTSLAMMTSFELNCLGSAIC